MPIDTKRPINVATIRAMFLVFSGRFFVAKNAMIIPPTLNMNGAVKPKTNILLVIIDGLSSSIDGLSSSISYQFNIFTN